ncbi:MAG TPA: hypothetical protein VN493_26365 [Thermoanaerobaculia bacterium]|nr:hypothetical protein [Thermoanaerobaculia bacterium]
MSFKTKELQVNLGEKGNELTTTCQTGSWATIPPVSSVGCSSPEAARDTLRQQLRKTLKTSS